MIIEDSAPERIVKIGQHLAKLWARVGCPVFLTQGTFATIHSNTAKGRHVTDKQPVL